MKENILIVEDEFIVANDLKIKLTKAGYSVCGIAASVKEAEQLIEKHKPTWVLLDIFLLNDSKGTDLAPQLAAKNIGFIYISANTNQSVLETAKATQPYGFLVKPFREKDLMIMLDIALQKHQYNLQIQQQREQIFRMQLEGLAHLTGPVNQKIGRLPSIVQSFIPFDLLRVVLPPRRDDDHFGFARTGYEEYQTYIKNELAAICGISGNDWTSNKISFLELDGGTISNGIEYRKCLLDDICEKRLNTQFRLVSRMSLNLRLKNGDHFALVFYSKNEDSYTENHLNLLRRSSPSLESMMQLLTDNQHPVIAEPRDQSARRSQAAKVSAEIPKFDGIIGKSTALLSVLDQINLVATSPTSVLITGESGTGKERVAQCIHKMSPRGKSPLVIVNCAALPANLIESELFGHEKGAFTGAIDRRVGKFEQASGGTIFLDEIGELPLDAQVKLLRVLQEMEFERVGSNKSIKVDVRVIAATNRNLEKEVSEGRFRLDLYYRLNVFPIFIPPLRERKEDIGILAKNFVEKFSLKTGRPVTGISAAALTQLKNYHWPGNIRELEHLIERQVLIKTEGLIENIALPQHQTEKNNQIDRQEGNIPLKTMEEMEADYIVHVLKNCQGRIGGPGGAAEILGMPPSTLHSRIKKLGIKREFSAD
ncbi:sigma 54-interacting transcriptional regulator [Mucilaginibacter psychrotolerans]|uniref:Response regulator n=1 Tax=Mucilaginibacter psychrotolerans TaxID=1524096 RepID=A0A4Y8SHB3_9SPHI|nr:sigma 54-interacting transcriptional regulator [Mucilaginibacter psychrotolerans]TFF37796.1 response regulator [Mucilaginibacter psychrotolerans]